MWVDDPLFDKNTASFLAKDTAPAFRLCGYFPHDAAHPFCLVDQWEAVFAVFKGVLEERCDRILMWDNPGAKARRGKSIQTSDWHPFRHLYVFNKGDLDGATMMGFAFRDRDEPTDGSCGGYPASLYFFVGNVIRIQATIPVASWLAGAIEIEKLISALSAIPFISLTIGYGLSISNRFSYGDGGGLFGQLIPVGRKYPALDIVHVDKRSYFDGDESMFEKIGLAAGINWITGVGEPFFSRGGGAKLGEGLPAGITSQTGTYSMIFRLGDSPITGQAGVDDATLPLYYALGERLAPLWSPSLRNDPVFGDDYARESLAWERRFFDGAGG